MVRLGVVGALLLGGPMLVAWYLQPARATGPCTVFAGPVPLPEMPETSGLAVGRRTPGVLWTHNDSGSNAVLFAIDGTGATLGRVRVPVGTRDWEDVSAAPCGARDCLYIADIGDNRVRRPVIQIYRVPEPAVGDAETASVEIFTATYADGPHNAEAMFVIGDTLFIVTRDRVGAVYKATLSSSRELTFQRISQLGLAAVTDAETSRDGTTVVVRTSREAVLYKSGEIGRGGTTPFARIPLDGLREPQGEGVALDGSLLYLSSEGGAGRRAGRITTLRCHLSRP